MILKAARRYRRCADVYKRQFLYWSLSENGEEVDVESYEIGGEVTFYAVFKIEEKNPNDPVVIAELEKGIEQLAAVRLSVKEQSKIRRCV